jgi:hypothetical protein
MCQFCQLRTVEPEKNELMIAYACAFN